MDAENRNIEPESPRIQPDPVAGRAVHTRIVSVPSNARYLDTVQLGQLEQSFRSWAEASSRPDVRLSRKRILLIFLLIRYTGAKLNEVLALNPFRDIDHDRQSVVFGGSDARNGRPPREVQIPASLSAEIRTALDEPAFKESASNLLGVDPGHVRRKFYERASACGLPQELGAPDVIRKSRAVELMQNNMPLPVVQRILGHATPNATASFVEFADDDIREVARLFIEKEARRRTSARNTFFGRICAITSGDIQAQVTVATIDSGQVTAVITNDSLIRLGLKAGSLVTAEIKAPWVILQEGDGEPDCTADNRFRGIIARVSRGKITTEYVVRLPDGTELCSVVTSESGRRLDLQENAPVWAVFSSFSVVLHVD